MALLEARKLCFSPHVSLRRRVGFSLEEGQASQIEGPSGAGKTTLLRVLARLHGYDAGELRFRGEDAAVIPPADWRRQVMLLPQRPAMLPGTVADNLALVGAPKRFRRELDMERGEELLARLALDSGRLLDLDALRLSGGEAARVALCRALLADPAVLLLDEPTASLDAASAEALIGLCVDELAAGRGLVLVAHDAGLWRETLGDRLASVALEVLEAEPERP